jgi:hypothetical protein
MFIFSFWLETTFLIYLKRHHRVALEQPFNFMQRIGRNFSANYRMLDEDA